MREKLAATLVGCAVGDALGMPVEGWPKARIQKHVGRITGMMSPVILRDDDGEKLAKDEFGKLGYWTEVFELGEYTDDTILTLAIAESIIRRGLPDLYDITQEQLEIYADFCEGRSNCGFGGTTKDAFKNLTAGCLPTKSGVIGGPGTGPAMKMAPIGMWIALEQDSHREAAGLYWAELIGKTTHLDPRSTVCGVLQAALISRCLKSHSTVRTRRGFIDLALWVCRNWEKPLTEKFKWHRKGSIADKISWVAENPDVSVWQAHQYLGSSSAVYQAYPFVLWMFQKFWEPKKSLNPIAGLEELVNCGGDCDTTGAMYGALVGAKHGMIFPDKWTSHLKNMDYVLDVSKRFAALGE